MYRYNCLVPQVQEINDTDGSIQSEELSLSSTLPVTRFSFLPFLRCLDTTENKVRQHFPTNLHFSTQESNNCKRLLQTSKEFEKQQAQTSRTIEQ